MRQRENGRRARSLWRAPLLAGLLAAAAGTMAAPARAGEEPSKEPPEKLEARREPVFLRGLKERDISVGYGFKIPWEHFDSRTNVPFVTLIPRFGRYQTSRRELLVEFPVTIYTEPDTAFSAGAAVTLRQHFARGGSIIPFAELGAGGILTDLDVKELGGVFQFQLHGGFGLRFVQSERSSIVLTARWYHLSNAGITSPNTGLNNGLITVGYSVFY